MYRKQKEREKSRLERKKKEEEEEEEPEEEEEKQEEEEPEEKNFNNNTYFSLSSSRSKKKNTSKSERRPSFTGSHASTLDSAFSMHTIYKHPKNPNPTSKKKKQSPRELQVSFTKFKKSLQIIEPEHLEEQLKQLALQLQEQQQTKNYKNNHNTVFTEEEQEQIVKICIAGHQDLKSWYNRNYLHPEFETGIQTFLAAREILIQRLNTLPTFIPNASKNSTVLTTAYKQHWITAPVWQRLLVKCIRAGLDFANYIIVQPYMIQNLIWSFVQSPEWNTAFTTKNDKSSERFFRLTLGPTTDLIFQSIPLVNRITGAEKHVFIQVLLSIINY